MEDFSVEVVETITDYYSKDGEEGKELTKDILFYLYHNTNNDKLKQAILDWFNEEQYCIECGEKLQPYEYCEIHTELEYNNKEWFTAWLCPGCDRDEVVQKWQCKVTIKRNQLRSKQWQTLLITMKTV